MRYFDRDANEITYDQWWKHTLDPKYTKVARNSYGVTDVLSQWVGLQSAFDEQPIIWCIFSRKFEENERSIITSLWFTDKVSIEQVLEFHKNLAIEVGIPATTKRSKK